MKQLWKSALALGAVLAACGAASADDKNTASPAGTTASTSMTLGGHGTAAKALVEDTELTGGYHHGHHGGYGYHGGYRGYSGGYGGYGYGYRGYSVGYGGYGYRGYSVGYGGYGYRSYYSVGYYRPAYYYSPVYYYPRPVYYGGGCGPGVGFTIGIGGAGSGAPAVQLGADPALTEPVQPMPTPAVPGSFQYDGGPANPIPMPKPDVKPIPPADPSSVPIGGTKAAPAPLKYKAYGEK
jgi:hypothetical protein